MSTKRFIEASFPVKEVSIESAKEKNIRHGHISTLHIWWARRPLASSRATNYAALIPAPENIDDWNKTREFIIEFSKWENSLNAARIEKARKDILAANGGKPPKVLDPFAGGGAIPLEALRLGCETYASDLNPVAVLIQKCTLEYPQQFGRPQEQKEKLALLSDRSLKNPLLEDVKKWGDRVLQEAKNEIGKFYPAEADGSVPVGYLWARTIPCQNPSCGAEIPLMFHFWLAKKPKKKVALFPYVEERNVRFTIVGTGYAKMPAGFDPAHGMVSRAVATCLVCGSVVDANTTRKQFQEGKAGQRMIAVIVHKIGQSGKRYRIATAQDMQIFKEAEAYLEQKREKLMLEWGIDPVPDEPIPENIGKGIRIKQYRMHTWGDLFNARQKLALITFVEKVRVAHRKMLEEGYEEEYARAVVSYLAIGVDRIGDYNTTLCSWHNTGEAIGHTFNRQALPIVWDYFELNPFNESTGDWQSALKWVCEVLSHCSHISSFLPATVTQSSVTALLYSDNFFDAVLTDPPYYDNIPYSYLSDFFYVWLKRTLGDVYPNLFSTPLTPKKTKSWSIPTDQAVLRQGKPSLKRCSRNPSRRSGES